MHEIEAGIDEARRAEELAALALAELEILEEEERRQAEEQEHCEAERKYVRRASCQTP